MSKPRNDRRRWTAKQDQYLRDHAHEPGYELAHALKRTIGAVMMRRSDLGVTSPREANQVPKTLVISALEKWAPIAGCTVDEILSDAKNGHISWARHQVIADLHAAGYRVTAVGRAFGIDHSSVVHCLDRLKRPCPPPSRYYLEGNTAYQRRSSLRLIITPQRPPILVRPALESSIAPVQKARLMAGR